MVLKGGDNMTYQRKTKDVWCIDTNYGYGWETESEYDEDDYEDPLKSAREDLKGYQEMMKSFHGQVRLRRKREKIIRKE